MTVLEAFVHFLSGITAAVILGLLGNLIEKLLPQKLRGTSWTSRIIIIIVSCVILYFDTLETSLWTVAGLISTITLGYYYLTKHSTKIFEKAAEPLRKWSDELNEYANKTRSLRPPSDSDIAAAFSNLEKSVKSSDSYDPVALEQLRTKTESAQSFSWFTWIERESMREQLEDMKRQLEAAQVPYLATSAVRQRLENQLSAAQILQDQATARTRLFQFLGSFAIIVGIGIVVTAVFTSINDDMKDLQVGILSVGVLTNLIGALLISFHKTTSRLALDYYDRRQRLFDQLTALELTTNNVLSGSTADVLADVIRSLLQVPNRDVKENS